jgi:hypothetical protein
MAVDDARLLVADLNALGAWEHARSLDGLADYVFWGRDAGQAAQAFRAPKLEANEFGWLNVAEDVAQERGTTVAEFRDKRGLKFATDYRPHSHHWRVMEPTRNSSTESGITEIEGMTVCNFMTTWGDGLFEVYRDLGESDELVQIRIELQ